MLKKNRESEVGMALRHVEIVDRGPQYNMRQEVALRAGGYAKVAEAEISCGNAYPAGSGSRSYPNQATGSQRPLPTSGNFFVFELFDLTLEFITNGSDGTVKIFILGGGAQKRATEFEIAFGIKYLPRTVMLG